MTKSRPKRQPDSKSPSQGVEGSSPLTDRLPLRWARLPPTLRLSGQVAVTRKTTVRTLFALTFGLFLLWLVFRGTDWHEVGAAIRPVRLGWLALSQVVLWTSFFVWVQRWSYIVRSSQSATFGSLFSAMQIGFLVNFTLPGRLGEVVRAVVLNRLERVSLPKCLGTVVLDRTMDLVGLALVLAVSALAFRPAGDIVLPEAICAWPIPAGLIRTGAIGAAALALTVAGTLLILHANRSLVLRVLNSTLGALSRRAADRVCVMLDQFAQGLDALSTRRDLAKAVVMSLVTWGLLVLSGALVLAAFPTDFPWHASFLVLSLGAVITLLPAAPGFIGQIHFAIVVALVLAVPEVDVNEAKAVAIVMHLLNLFPIAVLGAFCLLWKGIGVRELASNASRATVRPEATPGE